MLQLWANMTLTLPKTEPKKTMVIWMPVVAGSTTAVRMICLTSRSKTEQRSERKGWHPRWQFLWVSQLQSKQWTTYIHGNEAERHQVRQHLESRTDASIYSASCSPDYGMSNDKMILQTMHLALPTSTFLPLHFSSPRGPFTNFPQRSHRCKVNHRPETRLCHPKHQKPIMGKLKANTISHA